MITCIDSKSNDKFIKSLRDKYESLFEDGTGKMTVHRGKVHKYLGMTLDFSVKGQVKVSMCDCIDSILADFSKSAPKDEGVKVTAAPKDLFVVDEDCEKLTSTQSKNSTIWS